MAAGNLALEFAGSALGHQVALVEHRDPVGEMVGFFERHEHPEAGPYIALRPPVNYSATPANIRRHPPRLGQHTDEVLAEIEPRDGAE